MKHYLAVEGGATRALAGLYDGAGTLLCSASGPPCNPAEYGLDRTVEALARTLSTLLSNRERPVRLHGLFALAGVAEPGQGRRMGEALCCRLGLESACVASDLHPLLHANAQGSHALLALAGTGAAVLGFAPPMDFIKIGGRGAIMGDEGSGYRLSVAALRAAARAADGLAPATGLAETLSAAAGVPSLGTLPEWAARASKSEIAALAPAVMAAAQDGDDGALRCVHQQAQLLAEKIRAARARMNTPGQMRLFLHGGLLQRGSLFRDTLLEALREDAGLQPMDPAVTGHEAVLSLAHLKEDTAWLTHVRPKPGAHGQYARLSPTEAMPATGQLTLDAMTPHQIVEAMNSADASIAVADQAAAIAAAIEAAAAALRAGGRILYAGAGTSGRLGVLDASECPPTFGIAADRVVAIIAGGEKALRFSIEGAEDNENQGAASIEAQGISSQDFVLGIAASGTTSYTLAALRTAKAHGARTALLCCNPHCQTSADILIALPTGPEALAGSTRLKAGTATKMVLNMISTGAMALSGYVHEGLMVCMRPANNKLRERAVRIVCLLTEATPEKAAACLENAGYHIPSAVLMAAHGLDKNAARALLLQAGGTLKEALIRAESSR